jgi:hypothetical protein
MRSFGLQLMEAGLGSRSLVRRISFPSAPADRRIQASIAGDHFEIDRARWIGDMMDCRLAS